MPGALTSSTYVGVERPGHRRRANTWDSRSRRRSTVTHEHVAPQRPTRLSLAELIVRLNY